jgi:serine/threonine protein kinase
MLTKGMILNTAFDSYTIQGQIGEGGSGTVFKATSTNGESYAIKTISQTKGKEKIKRFKNEINFCQKCSNRHIINVIDYGVSTIDGDAITFYVMPVFGANLRSLMDKGMDPAKSVRLFLDICDGLRYAHSKDCVHRDIKPENILIADDGSAIIADFGIAHLIEADKATTVETREGSRLANFSYHAPEQTQGIPSSNATDIFALGLMLNEMFTGQIPFGENYRKIGSACPDYDFLDKLVQKMIAQDMNSRYQTIDELLLDFSAYRDEAQKSKQIATLSTPVPEGEISDPLYLQPALVKNLRIENNMLIATLTNDVNSVWIDCYQNALGGFTSMPFCYQRFSFRGNEAFYPLNDNGYQLEQRSIETLVSEFKQACSIANQRYASLLMNRLDQEKAAEIERRKREIERLESEKSLNTMLKKLL